MDEAGAVIDIEETAVADETEDEIVRPEGWSEETHSKSTDPNYAVVFPGDEINTMTITIEPEEWQAMLDDMTELYGFKQLSLSNNFNDATFMRDAVASDIFEEAGIASLIAPNATE